jgi:alpha-mannosidase
MTENEFMTEIAKAKRFLENTYSLLISNEEDLEVRYAISDKESFFDQRLQLSYTPIKKGERWGKAWDKAWFHLTAVAPPSMKCKKLALRININGEGLIFSPSGMPLSAVTCNSIFLENWSKEYFVFELEDNDGEIDYWLEGTAAYLNGTELQLQLKTGRQDYYCHDAVIKKMEFGIWNEDLWNLRNAIAMLVNAAEEFNSGRNAQKIMYSVAKALYIFAADSSNTMEALETLEPVLSSSGDSLAMKAFAVGHAHLDLAYLWTINESIRKTARTFANQVDLLKKCPDYIFGASQPLLYSFVKKYYPKLYSEIKNFVAEVRWELQGGMWVEADTNIPAPESLIRQFLLGKNFFKDEFGQEVKNLWLPDVFGYSAVLPQIIKKCGCNIFMTQKISWNETNPFPYNSFIWKGIDGSEVITHFPPENNYASMLTPSTLIKAQERFQENDRLDSFLSLYGVGDGGGGPVEEHVASGRMLKNFPGIPKVIFSRADTFFKELARQREILPAWHDELYLEKHRGTLTSQAILKKENRELEYLLPQIEILYSNTEKYPASELCRLWKLLLQNQFHDILPGSCIPAVRNDALRDYTEIKEGIKALKNDYAQKYLTPDSESIVVYNTASLPWRGFVKLPENWNSCSEFPCRNSPDGTIEAYITVPPGSSLTIHRSNTIVSILPVEGDKLCLENEFISYKFADNGTLVSIYDKQSKRSILQPDSKANLFSLYVDEPFMYDAWDIDADYMSTKPVHPEIISCNRVNNDAIGRQLLFKLKIGNSTIVQRISLTNDSKKLDFITSVDWNEEHRMLRVSFPLNIRADYASYDLGAGFIRRTMYPANSWEKAKFEVAAHRYADISNAQYGVALLNNCKYGHRICNSVIDLNLLRSPKYPDDSCDIGHHEFTYSLLPHEGSLETSSVIQEATQLNISPIIFYEYKGKIIPPCKIESPDSVVLKTIKKAERDNSLIIRLAEEKGIFAKLILKLTEDAEISECNMIEDDNGHVLSTASSIQLEFAPFEIKTLRINFSKKTLK